MVGDVISSGSQIIHAVEEVMQFGDTIERVVIVIDSEEDRGAERFRKYPKTNRLGTSLRVIFTKTELINHLS